MQLVSESVKTKQAQSFLLSEKQALVKQLQLVNASVESLKMRIFHSEEQVIVSTSSTDSDNFAINCSLSTNCMDHADEGSSDRSH